MNAVSVTGCITLCEANLAHGFSGRAATSNKDGNEHGKSANADDCSAGVGKER